MVAPDLTGCRKSADRLPAGKPLRIWAKGLPLRAGPGNATRVSPARAGRPTQDRCHPRNRGQRPTRRAGSARRGRGGRWPGALGPRLGKGQRGAVAGAMAPAMEAGGCCRPFGREQETHSVSPARAERSPADRQVRDGQTPAPGPAGAKRPPGAGRALAGGFWPPAGPDASVALWQGRWPLPWKRGVLSPHLAGTGNAQRFPRPRGTVPCRPAGPGSTEASARPGGGEAPAGGGAGAGRGLWPPAGPDAGVAPWQGRWPLPWKR